MQAVIKPRKMSVRACILKPGSKIVTQRLVDLIYPDDDIFDAMAETLYEMNVQNVAFRFVTEHFKTGKTIDVYVGFGIQEVEHNKEITKALANYFDTDEAFDIFGPCIIFAIFDNDIPVDFTGSDFNSLFYNL